MSIIQDPIPSTKSSSRKLGDVPSILTRGLSLTTANQEVF